MNFREIILDSLKYPFSDVKRVTGLILLLLGSILIIPAIMALGYILRIIEHTTNGSNELPQFDEWGEMFTDGLKYLAATVIYLIIPNILMIVVFPGILTSYSGGFQIGMYLLSNVIGLIIFTPFRLIYFIALGNMAYERRFGAAFEFNNIFRFIGEIGWLKYIVYLLVFAIIGDLFGLISSAALYLQISQGLAGLIIGGILSLLISIYMVMYGARFIGLIYRKGSCSVKDGPETESNPEIKENKDIGTV